MYQITPALSVFLDIARAIAAFLVVIGHIKLIFFKNVVFKGAIIGSFFDFITSFSHQAVMIFFVLSGFLIARSAHVSLKKNNLLQYAIKRVTRLWIVLIPALVMTFFWDMWTVHAFSEAGPFFFEKRLTWEAFCGNALFLQDILVPRFGSNGPLWSLANEFWYYVLFPVMVLIYMKYKKASYIFVPFILLVVLILFLPTNIIKYYTVWLLGAMLWQVNYQVIKNMWLVLLLFIGLFSMSYLEFTQMSPLGFFMDLSIAASFGLLINYVMFSNKVTFSEYMSKLSIGFADFSYSLYLLHFPFMVFLKNLLDSWNLISIANINLFGQVLLFMGILIVVYIYAFGIYLLTEKHTRKLQQWAVAKIVS